MYPYKIYNMGDGEMVYNHDNSIENEIYITIDKMINKTLLTTDIRLIDILYDYYKNNSCECIETINTIINICSHELKYEHIKILCEYMSLVHDTELYY